MDEPAGTGSTWQVPTVPSEAGSDVPDPLWTRQQLVSTLVGTFLRAGDHWWSLVDVAQFRTETVLRFSVGNSSRTSRIIVMSIYVDGDEHDVPT